MTAEHPARAIPALAILLTATIAFPAAAQEGEAAPAGAGQPEVVVSASRVPVPPREAGTAVTVITGEDLEDHQVRFVSDALRRVPGLAVGRTGTMGSLTQVRIRGAEANHTLVLMDGIEVGNPASSAEFDFGNLIAADIARIEILRGPQSALYGSDAIGGVINIITRRPGKGWSGTGRAEAGSFATWDGVGYLGYGADKAWASGTVIGHKTNGISVADEDNGNPEDDGYSSVTGRIKAGFQPLPNLDLEAVGWRVDSARDSDSDFGDGDVFDSGDNSETEQRYGRLGGKLTLAGGAWEHLVNASYMNDITEFFDGDGDQTFRTEGEKAKYDYQSNVFLSSHGGDAEHTFTVAAEYEWEEQANASSDVVSIHNRGYVGEYRLALVEKLFLSGGLRYDDNDELFDDAVTWRTTAAYLSEALDARLHASLGTGVKNPTLFELYGSTPDFTGNPDLTPEKSIGWDIGVEKPVFGGAAVVDVTYFRNRITDLIQGSGDTAVNRSGTSRIQGVEVSLGADPAPRWHLDASYTYTDAEDSEGSELVRRPRHMASLGLLHDFQIYQRPATANLALELNGDQRDEDQELHGVALLSAGVSWRVREGVELFARGENLLDQHYQEVLGYGTPGIAAYAGLRVNFGPGGR